MTAILNNSNTRRGLRGLGCGCNCGGKCGGSIGEIAAGTSWWGQKTDTGITLSLKGRIAAFMLVSGIFYGIGYYRGLTAKK